MSDLEMTTLDALSMWHRILGRAMRSLQFDYSARQLSILFTIYLKNSPHTIRSLAAELGISKAAICRAIDALSAAEFVRRVKDEDDKRNVFIERTPKGSVFLSDFADIVMQEMGTDSPNGDGESSISPARLKRVTLRQEV